MNTKMRFEAMEKALPYVAELLDNAALIDFKELMKAKEKPSSGVMLKNLMQIFLIEKRETVFGMLGAVSGKTIDEIEQQDWEETKKLLDDSIMNDVCDFFIFSVRMVRSV